MKKLLLFLLLCSCLPALAQPILRNPFTTNANPNGLTVVDTNGVYELQSTKPLSIPGGLFLGGTNGGGTNNIGVTNFFLTTIPMTIGQIGTGVGSFEQSNSNSITFLRPILKADNGKSSNFVNYICYAPANLNVIATPHIVVNVLKVGTGTSNVVLQLSFGNGSTALSALGTAFTYTNSVTGGSGVARATSFEITTPWNAISGASPFGVQVARVGDDTADQQADIIIQSVVAMFYLK